MYLSSPAKARVALGPGSAVLILGPTARVLVVMRVSPHRIWLVVRGLLPEVCLDPSAQCGAWPSSSESDSEIWEQEVSRCRTGSHARRKAGMPDNAAGKPASAANTREGANWTETHA